MSVALEIVNDNGENLDLDRWCHYAKREGQFLYAEMSFGSPIVATDSEEIVELKKKEALNDCDKFIETMAPFVGKVVTVIHEATKVSTVKIPDNLGLENETSMVWPLYFESEIDQVNQVPDFTTLTPAVIAAREILLKAMTDLTAAVEKLTNAISAKREG